MCYATVEKEKTAPKRFCSEEQNALDFMSGDSKMILDLTFNPYQCYHFIFKGAGMLQRK